MLYDKYDYIFILLYPFTFFVCFLLFFFLLIFFKKRAREAANVGKFLLLL